MAKKPKTLAGEKPTGKIVPVGQASEVDKASALTFVRASAQAAEVLGIASSTATDTGHDGFAKAAQAAQVQINNNTNIFVLGDSNTVSPQQSFDIDQDIAVKQQCAERMEKELAAAGVDFKECVEQRQEHLNQAKMGWLATGKAWTLYLECLALKALSGYLR